MQITCQTHPKQLVSNPAALRLLNSLPRYSIAAAYAPTMGLVSVPIPSTVTLVVSPAFNQIGGFRANPTPGGVPVEIRSPTSHVSDWER